MASTLKQQLAALNQAAPGAKRPKGGKPSLLFDFRTAADVDLQAIYELGSAGEGGRDPFSAGIHCCWAGCVARRWRSAIVLPAHTPPCCSPNFLAARRLPAPVPSLRYNVHGYAGLVPQQHGGVVGRRKDRLFGHSIEPACASRFIAHLQ
eukprot:1147182-Pelagomonas_calceolata.AAC.5